jgi:hypothetical protein
MQTSPTSSPGCYRSATDGLDIKDPIVMASLSSSRQAKVDFGIICDESAGDRVGARKVVAQMDARVFADVRGLANITLKEFIDWYCEVIVFG